MHRPAARHEAGRWMQVLEDQEASGSTEERRWQRSNGIVTARGKKNFSLCVSSQFKGYRRPKAVKAWKGFSRGKKAKFCELKGAVVG